MDKSKGKLKKSSFKPSEITYSTKGNGNVKFPNSLKIIRKRNEDDDDESNSRPIDYS